MDGCISISPQKPQLHPQKRHKSTAFGEHTQVNTYKTVKFKYFCVFDRWQCVHKTHHLLLLREQDTENEYKKESITEESVFAKGEKSHYAC